MHITHTNRSGCELLHLALILFTLLKISIIVLCCEKSCIPPITIHWSRLSLLLGWRRKRRHITKPAYGWYIVFYRIRDFATKNSHDVNRLVDPNVPGAYSLVIKFFLRDELHKIGTNGSRYDIENLNAIVSMVKSCNISHTVLWLNLQAIYYVHHGQ